jgi:hypothetical protein
MLTIYTRGLNQGKYSGKVLKIRFLLKLINFLQKFFDKILLVKRKDSHS